MINNKFNYWLILLISIFFGYFGIDRFIIGDYKFGLIKLFSCGGCGILWLIDIILFATKTNNNIEYTTSKNSKIIGISILGFLCFYGLIFNISKSYVKNNKKLSSSISTPIKSTDNNKVTSTSTPNITINPTPTRTLTPEEIKKQKEAEEKLDKYIKEYENTITPKPTKETEIKYDSKITYNNLSRNPEKYKGKGIVFTGKIIQVIESDSGSTYRIAINSNYNNVMVAYYFIKNNENRLLENDIIRFKGLYTGLYTYKTVLGASQTVPSVIINDVKIQ